MGSAGEGGEAVFEVEDDSVLFEKLLAEARCIGFERRDTGGNGHGDYLLGSCWHGSIGIINRISTGRSRSTIESLSSAIKLIHGLEREMVGALTSVDVQLLID